MKIQFLVTYSVVGLLSVQSETDLNETTSAPETTTSAEKAFCEGKCDPSTNTKCVVNYGKVQTHGGDVIEFIGGYTCHCKSDFELNAAGQCIAIVNSTTQGPAPQHNTTVSPTTTDIYDDSKRDVDNHKGMHVLNFRI